MMTMQFYMHLTNITNILEAIRLTEDVYLYKKHNNGWQTDIPLVSNTCSWWMTADSHKPSTN